MGPVWPAQAPVPPFAASARAGMVEDHIVVKEGDCEGVLAKLLSLGIVTWTAGYFVQSPGALLLICQCSRGLLAMGRILAWAVLGRIRLSFSWKNRNSFSFLFLS